MRILMTGAAGYTGRGIVQSLRPAHWVRGFLLEQDEGHDLDDSVIGDLQSIADCRIAVENIDAVIMCHMAPNPEGYKTPETAIDVNVKGTTNLYQAMVENGVKTCIVIGSRSSLVGNGKTSATVGEGPYRYDSKQLYPLTKVLHECIARHYYESFGIATAILRPSYICYDESLVNKYGATLTDYGPGLCDPRDIGTAASLALELDGLGCEGFDLGLDGDVIDFGPARDRLGWRPRYTFDSIRETEALGV